MSAIFARFRAASASALLIAVLALEGTASSPSAQGQALSPWAIEYAQFVTPSDGWAMAYKNGPNRFTELFTSHDGGRHWHNVTPPVVVAGEKPSAHNPMEPQTPFVLNGRDAWLPVDCGYGQPYEVFMTSDGGQRWALRGRFPGAEVQGMFFLNPSTGFIETDEGAASDDDPAQVYATSDGGEHWREVWDPPPPQAPGGSAPSARQWDFGDKTGVSFASPRVGFATLYYFGPGGAVQRTSDGGRKWDLMPIASGKGAGDGEGGTTYPPVFSSPEVGSMVVQVGPVVLVATTTDAGRHWALRHPPAPAERLFSAHDDLPVDLVSARTWVVGASHELYTTTEAGLAWRASYSPMALTGLQLDFLGPRVGWAYAGDVYGDWDARMVPLWRTTDGGRHWSAYSLGAS